MYDFDRYAYCVVSGKQKGVLSELRLHLPGRTLGLPEAPNICVTFGALGNPDIEKLPEVVGRYRRPVADVIRDLIRWNGSRDPAPSGTVTFSAKKRNPEDLIEVTIGTFSRGVFTRVDPVDPADQGAVDAALAVFAHISAASASG